MISMSTVKFSQSVTNHRIVDFDQNSGVSWRVSPWERNQWAWSSAATARNRDLSARQIKLRSVHRASGMKADMLNPCKIITGWRVFWDWETESRQTYPLLATTSYRQATHTACRPDPSVWIESSRAFFPNLEPNSTTPVPGRSSLSGWNFSQVAHTWARMLNVWVDNKADGLSCRHWQDTWSKCGGCILSTSDIQQRSVCYRSMAVRVGSLSDCGIFRKDGCGMKGIPCCQIVWVVPP